MWGFFCPSGTGRLLFTGMSLAACDTQETGMMQQQTITVHDPLIVIVTSSSNSHGLKTYVSFLMAWQALAATFLLATPPLQGQRCRETTPGPGLLLRGG